MSACTWLFTRTVRSAEFVYPARSARGQNQVEFVASFVVLILFVVFPMINFGAIPVRIGLAQALIKDEVSRLAKSERFSVARKAIEQDSGLQQRLSAIGGISTKAIGLELRMSKVNDPDKSVSSERVGGIPEPWLPDGSNCPCSAQIRLTVQGGVSPLIVCPQFGQEVPGLTGPFPITFVESAPWENLGRNPETGEFFLNE